MLWSCVAMCGLVLQCLTNQHVAMYNKSAHSRTLHIQTHQTTASRTCGGGQPGCSASLPSIASSHVCTCARMGHWRTRRRMLCFNWCSSSSDSSLSLGCLSAHQVTLAATYCNMLRRTATTHYNTLQRTAVHCKRTATHLFFALSWLSVRSSGLSCCKTLQYTAKHCNALQPIAIHCNTHKRKKESTRSRAPATLAEFVATHYNTLQHTATH